MMRADFMHQGQADECGVVVGENIEEDIILGWKAEGETGDSIMRQCTAGPMFVVSRLAERSEELQGMRIPRRWTKEDGGRSVAGMRGLEEKWVEFAGWRDIWQRRMGRADEENVVKGDDGAEDAGKIEMGGIGESSSLH
jgi:hypothetical protein